MGAVGLLSEPAPGAGSLHNGTLRYSGDAHLQDVLRQRLHELAAVRVRFGYRRPTVLLRREGRRVNAKRIYRLYGLEGLEVQTKPRKKLAQSCPCPPADPRIRGAGGGPIADQRDSSSKLVSRALHDYFAVLVFRGG